MSNEEIDAYYKKIDALVDKKPKKTINLGTIDYETKKKIDAECSDKTKYFENDIEFSYNGIQHHYERTPVKPDGYVDFNNYYYRNISGRKMNYIQYAKDRINPLTTRPGYIITDKDIPVYTRLYETEGSVQKFIEYKEAGLLKAKTVIHVDGISLDGYIFLPVAFKLQGYVKATDIKILAELFESVSYKIIDDKLYRFIEGQKIEMPYAKNESGYRNGYKYIRNDIIDPEPFYFWELWGDYFFDGAGNFTGVEDFGPDWTGM